MYLCISKWVKLQWTFINNSLNLLQNFGMIFCNAENFHFPMKKTRQTTYIICYVLCSSLQLNDNNICRVNRYAFRDTASLRSLSLKNNRLTRLPQDAFNAIKNQIMKFDVAGNVIGEVGWFSDLNFWRIQLPSASLTKFRPEKLNHMKEKM